MLGESSSANIFFLRQLQTKDITRADIVGAVGSLFRSGRIPNFINAYVNIIANPNTNPPPLAVTGVYSQGCVFRQGRPPTCSGPVSIEIVPEQAAVFLQPIS